MINWIKETPQAFTFLMGDLFDSVTKTSVGNVYEQEYNLKNAKKELARLLEPIKHKTLGCISGNHCERIEKAVGDNPVEDLAYRLDIDYFPNWSAYLFLGVGEARTGDKLDRRRPIYYSVFLHHLTGGGATKGGKVNRVAKLREMCMAQVMIGAHVHMKSAFETKYLYPDLNGFALRELKQLFVTTGSFMGYASYSIKGMYDKPATGAPRIRFSGSPEKGNDVHVSL